MVIYIIKIPEEKVDFDSTSLNILLHDSLCRRFPSEEIEKFHIEIDTNAKNPLDSVYMSYDVSWPMNIILHTESLAMYNKVFVFLLRYTTLKKVQGKNL